MRRGLFLIILSTLCLTSSAQIMDSIRAAMKHKPKFMFRFDSRNSFIRNQNVKLTGFQVGVDFNHTIRVGIGFHDLNPGPQVSQPWEYINENNQPDTGLGMLRFGYMAWFVEYVFYKTRKWEFTVPVSFGQGDTKFDLLEEAGGRLIKTGIRENRVSLIEADVTGQYKIIPWFGFGAGVGYRQMIKNNPHIKVRLSSPIYIFKAKVFIGDLYRSIFNKQKKIEHNTKDTELSE